MTNFVQVAAFVAEGAFVVAGCVLAWIHVLGPDARLNRNSARLPAWDATPVELLLFLFHAVAGGFLGSATAGFVAKGYGLDGDRVAIIGTATAHVGLLAGAAVFIVSSRGRFALGLGAPAAVLRSGLVTFLIALPFAFGTGLLWTLLLQACGVPAEKQLAVEMLGRISSPTWMALFLAGAVVTAPISEELLFRAGIFRFLRTRLPRWAAILVPAILFSAAHVNLATCVQLTVLGVIFAVSYERTGSLGTAIVAHAAFNLNNVLLILAGGLE